jgi:hypothetical protein
MLAALYFVFIPLLSGCRTVREETELSLLRAKMLALGPVILMEPLKKLD